MGEKNTMYHSLDLDTVYEVSDEVEELRRQWTPIAEFCLHISRTCVPLRDIEVDFLEDLLDGDHRIRLSVRQAAWLLRIFTRTMPRSERRREPYIKDEWWDFVMLYELEWAPWGLPPPPPRKFDD